MKTSYGQRVVVAIFAVVATYALINLSIRWCGAVSDLIRDAASPQSGSMTIGCTASIQRCNAGYASEGLVQSLFRGVSEGPCTQCHPGVSMLRFIAEVMVLLGPGIALFWLLGRYPIPIRTQSSRNMSFFFMALFFFFVMDMVENTFHVFFGP